MSLRRFIQDKLTDAQLGAINKIVDGYQIIVNQSNVSTTL